MKTSFSAHRSLITFGPLAASITLVALFGAACSPPNPPRDDALSREHSPKHDSGPPSVTIEVTYQGESHRVDLTSPAPVQLPGGTYARLAEVVTLAFPGLPLMTSRVDFEASDGFHPGQSPNCAGVTPIPGEALTQGYVHTQSRNLRWEDSLAYPGCMGIHDLAQILITPSP